LIAVDVDRKRRFGDALRLPAQAGEGAPGAETGPLMHGQPALFQSDWKDDWFTHAREVVGQERFDMPASLPRTHTQISPTGVAQERLLFTTVYRSTRNPLKPADARRFLFTTDTAAVPAQEKGNADALVGMLAEGLDAVGKTGASASFQRWPAGDTPAAVAAVLGYPDLFAVVLRTPAVLTDPGAESSAADAYTAYWTQAVPGASLINFCAAQHLAGGYLATRRRPWNGRYHPFVLTEAGSVFLLAGPIKDRLAALIRTGLPVAAFAGASPLDWRNCPFVPGNGFGEIRVDYLSAKPPMPADDEPVGWAEVQHV
jgi:hypothetical protein